MLICILTLQEDGARAGLIFLFVFLQLLSYILYTLSYIPFAFTCIKNTCKGMCGC